jgi:hypothetical protein
MLDRRCNECTLCCKLLPIAEIGKAANTRCTHQRIGKGCRVYDGPAFPKSCATWSCMWLTDAATKDLMRPDRAHYVIDVMPDFITVEQHDGSPPVTIAVIQVWVDPKYPHAHRDPALRTYLAHRAEKFDQLALIRYDAHNGFVLVPPSMTSTGEWHEQPSNYTGEHSPEEIIDTLYLQGEIHVKTAARDCAGSD